MDIIVIGGGAAGLMAAIHAAKDGAKVRLLERNDKIGKKILVTGNGKCNLSNLDSSLEHYVSHDTGRLREVFDAFSFSDAQRFFEECGIVLKSRKGWLYPYCEQAQAVVSVLERKAREMGVSIKTRENVISVQKEENGFTVNTETWHYPADRVILTTGGPASLVEGSGKEGMLLAADLGHQLYDPLPALVPLRIREKKYGVWAGTRMDATASLYIDGSLSGREQGEIQFADYGISGIAVFQLSIAAVQAVRAGKKAEIILDLFPQNTENELQELLENRRNALKISREEELFTGLLPDRMIKALITKKPKAAAAYARLFKELKVTVQDAHSFERAQVASGGISLSDIDTKTMQSLKVPGMYFAGEILDVCAHCGGYNLQWAWSSGALAGRSAAK